MPRPILRTRYPDTKNSICILLTTMNEIDRVIHLILQDIKVELGDEFDKNFERQGFFSEKWARRKSPLRPGGPILIDTGNLRRSVQSKVDTTSITFFSDLPYASIHNDGGEIKVTAKRKVGQKIKIPRRRFLGTSPEVERSVREIIEEELEQYFNNIKI